MSLKIYKNLSLKNKIALPVAGLVSIGIIITMIVTTYKTKDIIIDEAKNSTLPAYRDTVLDALTTMMITGKFKDGKKPFLEQMSHIANVHVIRSEETDKDFGRGEESDYAFDELEKKVLETGIEVITLEGDALRGIYPYIAKANFMGKNCLNCHNVKEGTVLGAVSIKIPLDRSFRIISSARNLYLGLGIVGIAAVTVLIFLMVFTIFRPLRSLIDKVEQLSRGDLRVIIDNSRTDEIGTLSKSMNSMVQYFNKTINSILSSANNVVNAVDAIRPASGKISEGAKNQSSQAHQIAAAAEEMSQTITDIARNASTASSSSSEALEIAESGKEVTEIAVETINKVYNSTVELSTLIERLNKRSSEIGDIVTLIKEIADQTNLLALNAAIEAARAGEQGRGFAVVADEVRKLAEKTIKATTEISTKIKAVQAESEQTTFSMAEASNNVTKATGHVKNLSNVLQAIVESVQKVRDEITQIATATDEQSSVSEEVARNIEKTSAIAKDMEVMAGDMTHHVSALTKVAEELRGSVDTFKTTGSELMILDLAKGDHRTWVNKISAHLRGDERLDPEKLADHTKCRFGKWYYGEGMERCGGMKPFKEIEAYHDRVHSLGKEAVLSYNAGDRAKAEKLFKEMEEASHYVVSLLDEIKREWKQN
ncbi:MAG: methyl-accepting chemotaxis protein [Thermodesulfovibrionales bacterium]